MEYLINLKQYINENLKSIPVPEHQLDKQVDFSNSKLEKDFKKQEGLTLRKYLIRLKIELAIRLKQENNSLRNIELMADINYNYSERAFRNHLKQYGLDFFENKELLEFCLLSQNKEIFLEIFIRFILYNNLAEVETDDGRLIIKHNVKDNYVFQFASFFVPLESTHTYFIYLDIDKMKLSYSMFIQRLINMDEEDDEQCYIPNHITPYFNLLYNIEKAFESQINYKLTDCIKEWDKYATVKSSMSFIFSSHNFFNLEVNASNSVIKMNKNTYFIDTTNSIIDYLKTKLFNEFEEKFNSVFCFSLSEIKQYLKFVKEDSYIKMKGFITKFNRLKIKEIDFIVQVTSYPYLSDIDIYNYCYYVEDISILKALKKLTKTDLADLLIKFNINYNNIDEFDDETTIEELLTDLLF